jgi:hypothetical protein
MVAHPTQTVPNQEGKQIMANTETVHLSMTPQEADSLAYVLMTSLHTVSMLDRERTDAANAANALFKQLGYGHGTNEQGERVEWGKKVTVSNEELAKAAVIKIASEDEYWRPGDERLVTVEAVSYGHFKFSVAGMHTDYGCVRIQDGKADVFYHDDETMVSCEVCTWPAGS